MEFEHITDDEAVAVYKASNHIFEGILMEIRGLSKKKPDATMSEGKVRIVNRVLGDLKSFLENEPEGKYLDLLSDEALPQVSDAVLVMVQYETALQSFSNRYHRAVPFDQGDRTWRWVTPEVIRQYEAYLKQRASYYEQD